MDFTQPQNLSEFNSGIATIYRLDIILKHLHSARFYKNYDSVYTTLVSFWMELSCQLGKSERDKKLYDEHIKKWKEVQNVYARLKEAIAKGKRSFPTKDLFIFEEWELMLRKLMQDLGLGMPKRADSRFAMMN